MGRVEDDRAQRERLYDERMRAARQALQTVKAPELASKIKPTVPKLAKASSDILPRQVAGSLPKQAPAEADFLAGLVAEIRAGVVAGEDDAGLVARARSYQSSRAGLARAAKLGKDRCAEIASKAGKARRKPA